MRYDMARTRGAISCVIILMMTTLSCASRLDSFSAGAPTTPHIYHTSSFGDTPGMLVFEGIGRLSAGLFKPLEWFEALQHVVIDAARDPVREVRLAVLSDMNGSYGSTTYKEPVHGAVDALVSHFEPSLVISTGDMVAGMKKGLDYQAMWDAFHKVVTHPLTNAGVPFAPTPGNHDGTNRPGFALEREIYASTWKAHRPDLDFVDDTHYPRRYAFMHQGVLLISIDASTVGRLSRPQRAWLEGVLQANEQVKAKIVYGHVPLYPFARGRETEILNDQGLEEMFAKYGVTAYISGHHHAYYPGRREQGLRLVSMACLGGGPRRLISSTSSDPSPRALAIIEVDPQTGEFNVEAYSAQDFQDRIERSGLPESIGEGEQLIIRDDL